AFLFDEPLSNLDALLRSEMRVEIKKLHHRLGNTIIYVTHDQVEAMTLADRIVVLQAGNLIQYDTPDGIYNRPAAKFVAGFTRAASARVAARCICQAESICPFRPCASPDARPTQDATLPSGCGPSTSVQAH